ncbi:MAG: prepilin peptidase [Tissierellales bacterium]|jgi:leader peptidase (prepilin peptidase)/N-methyltransferase|nr:prepilin peptidase [Tissierellales bacterium]
MIGLLIGTFVNTCIERIPYEHGDSYIYSVCPVCYEKIKFPENIPFIGPFFNTWKCNSCGTRLSVRKLIIELINGVLFLLVYYTYGNSLSSLYFMIMCSILLIIFVIDYDHMIIPYRLNFILGFMGVINLIIGINSVGVKNAFLGAGLGFGLFLLIAIVTKGAMGGGDILLMGVLGLNFGYNIIWLIIMLSFLIGGFFSLLILLTGIKSRKESIPFGPFITISTILVILHGNNILSMYWSIMS